MKEHDEYPAAEDERTPKKINSPIEMAKALRFIPDPISRGRERYYSRDSGADFLPIETILHSEDFHDGTLEEVHVGVRAKESSENWSMENNVLSDTFLDWFVENGGDAVLKEEIKKLEDSIEKGRIKKIDMRKKGYAKVVEIIQQADRLGYFEYLTNLFTDELERKKIINESNAMIAEAAVKVFLAEFPQYTIFSNLLREEGDFYAAIPTIKKGRVQAMKITIHPSHSAKGQDTVEFQLGSMILDEQKTLSRFHQVNPPVLPSTGKPQQRWFRGEMGAIVEEAITARKNLEGSKEVN